MTVDAPFDFAALERKIVATSVTAFADVARAYPTERVCAFALYSDDGAMTVCPAFDLAARRDDRVAKHADDADAYTFGTAEWALESFGATAEFNAICAEVATSVMRCEGDAFVAFKTQLFETCRRALEQLRADGVIAADLLVMFAVSDTDLVAADEIRTMERLNGASPYVAQFRRWTERWG